MEFKEFRDLQQSYLEDLFNETNNIKEPMVKITIFVVWDRLYERVVSTHRTEKGAVDKCRQENEKRGRENGWNDPIDWPLDFEYDEFEIEE